MADPTYASFVSALSGLSVTGVTRKVSQPPRQVNTAELPLQYTQLPTGEEESRSRDHPGGWLTITCEVVVLLEPILQSTQTLNYAATVAMMDNLSAALRATDFARSRNRWTIRGSLVNLGNDTVYWGVVARVSNNHL